MVLLGRDTELQVVDRLIAGTRDGRGGALVVSGEPGVGKTALLEDALRRLDGIRLLRMTGTETEREIPFAALQALLRPALALLDAIPEPQSEALSAALALRPGRAPDRFAIGAATLSLVCRYAEDRPVTVCVDDLQWLDRPSAEALAFTARRVGDDPVALLFAARSHESADIVAGLPDLELTGLDADAAAELVCATGGIARTHDELRRLHELTGGNPLALLELGRDHAALEEHAPEVPPPVTARLTAAFSRRLRALDDAARSVLLVAVVANGDARLTAAGCIRLGLDPTGLARAERAGLVTVSHGRIAFSNPLVRAVAYAEADDRLRRSAHRALAGLLPLDDADRRAWHLSEAVDGPDAAIADMLDSTAEHAVTRAAYAVASTAYERAARLSPDPEVGRGRLHEAASTAWAGGLRERAVALLDELESLPAPPGAACTTLRLRAEIAARSGSLSTARDDLERAAAEASADDTVVLLAEALRASLYLVDMAAVRRLGDSLSEAVRRAGAPRATAVGLVAAGIAKVLTGGSGVDDLRAAVPMLAAHSDPLLHPEALPWLMLAPLFLRDAQSGAELRRLVDQMRSRVGVGALPSLLFHVARDDATTRAWARAEANYEESIRLARETGQSTELAMSLSGLAWLESRQGNGDACRAHAVEAMGLCSERAIHFGEIWCRFAVGDLALAEGHAATAVGGLLALGRRLGELGVADPDLFPGAELVDALLRLGREDEARAIAERFSTAADEQGRPWTCARGYRALGLVATDAALDAPFHTALECHADTLDEFETARTRLAFGERLRRASRRVDARTQLREALETFEDLGAVGWARVTAAELRATGERVAPSEPTGVGSLTPQELQVSLLLVEGRTTRETAAALFLSPKTVEYHLRKVYTKLAIHSRSELSELLLNSGSTAG